jgi:hypothetical protein
MAFPGGAWCFADQTSFIGDLTLHRIFSAPSCARGLRSADLSATFGDLLTP